VFIIKTLKKRPVWVAWNLEKNKDGKPTKIPKNPRTGFNAKSDTPDSWASYEYAVTACEQFRFSGVGFMFTDGICGIDLDDQSPDDARAAEIIKLMDTYTEISPSGTGLHIIFTADTSKLPEIEAYKAQFYQKNDSNAARDDIIHYDVITDGFCRPTKHKQRRPEMQCMYINLHTDMSVRRM